MTTQDILELAARCERHAAHHFALAAMQPPQSGVDLHNIDKGLACLDRAAALKARAHTKGEE